MISFEQFFEKKRVKIVSWASFRESTNEKKYQVFKKWAKMTLYANFFAFFLLNAQS